MSKRIVSLAVLLLAAVCVRGLSAAPGFTMRIDDNHSPADWMRVAEIFERVGMRCSFAIVPCGLNEAQGACLKRLAARGHLLMDHTPNHSFYSIRYPDAASFARGRALPFAVEADAKSRQVLFRCEVDAAHPGNRRVRASVVDNCLVFSQKVVVGAYVFVGIPGRPGVYGLGNRSANGIRLLDFHRRTLKEKLDVAETDVILYDQLALQPCDDLLRELARVSRERFDHFGLPRPTVWVRPGGWCPGVDWHALERIYGREFGYVGADSSIGADIPPKRNRWTTGRNAMYFFDQGADITPEQLVGNVLKTTSAGAPYVLLSHMWCRSLPGGMEEFFRKTERFAALLAAHKVPSMTMAEVLDDRFGPFVPAAAGR